jgi:hypothetical protein
VALPLQKLCQKGAGRPRSQNEDAHGVKETLPQSNAATEASVVKLFLRGCLVTHTAGLPWDQRAWRAGQG